MNLLCLMPTYGRKPELLNNSIACFLHQDHVEKHLLIYDDLGTLEFTPSPSPDITIVSSSQRSGSVGAKYNEMVSRYEGLFSGVVVWDDDDVYLPTHLSTHNRILLDYEWSKPSTIISSYYTPPQEEDARGRFHGSIAIRAGLLLDIGGWIDTKRPTFDQEMLEKLDTYVKPGDPCSVAPPTYIYRWQTSQSSHCSAGMSNPNWYDDYKPDNTTPIDHLSPQYDKDTEAVMLGMFSS